MDFDQLVQNGKVKRIFRAKRKIIAPDIVSHITQRSAGKDPLFLEDDDYLSMLSLLKEISVKYNLEVYSFCLMPTHIHLLVSPKEKKLNELMRDLFSRYAMRFNKKYMRKGHLFAGPYRQAVCLDDTYLLAASLYIHMNPVRAGLVQSPENFRWSSFGVFHSLNEIPSFLKPDFILNLLGGNKNKNREIYRELIARSVKVKVDDAMENVDAVARFRKNLSNIFPALFLKVNTRKKIHEKMGLSLIAEEEIEKLIDENLIPNSRNGKRFLVQQLIARGYKRNEIAEKLNLSVKTIYNILHSKE